jgi:hypothetical protein
MQTDLHDWTLVSINVSWVTSVVEVLFLNQESDNVKLLAHGFSELNIPKLEPWGESVSVNNFEMAEIGDDRIKASIEMQTGDLIMVTARKIELSWCRRAQ